MIIENQEYKVIAIKEDNLGLANSNDIKKAIETELSNGNKYIALDLSELNSINSAGLGVLIGILNKVKVQNGTLKMLNINERIISIFKITKLDLVFEIGK
ncbi:MAG: STAS domain-containing protein [Ignavibacteriota bacterium]|nr:STAS domain-containing protein [Ignavibacteriota bacterium]